MFNPLRIFQPSRSAQPPAAILCVAGAVLAAVVVLPRTPQAQQARVHLNPVVAKLIEGKTVYGLNTGDLSLANARDIARAPVDFVYADQEHNPLDFPSLHMFLLGMTDKFTIMKKGNLQPNVALFARFPPKPTSRGGW